MESTRENSNENIRKAPQSLYDLLRANREKRNTEDSAVISLGKIYNPLQKGAKIYSRDESVIIDDDAMKTTTTKEKATQNIITKFSERLLRKEREIETKGKTELELAALHLQAAGDCLIIAQATGFLRKDSTEIGKKVIEHLNASGTTNKTNALDTLNTVYRARTTGLINHEIERLEHNKKNEHK